LKAKQIKDRISKIAQELNLVLLGREAAGTPQNQWAALCAAHENSGKFPESQIIARLYDAVRTYFIKNS